MKNWDLNICLWGDYGKENNIKASFMGYDKRNKRCIYRPRWGIVLYS